MQNHLARAAIPLDPQHTLRPWPRHDRDQHPAVRHWQALLDGSHESSTFVGALDRGLIENRNPPTPPAVAAQRETDDALFRSIASDRRRIAREHLA